MHTPKYILATALSLFILSASAQKVDVKQQFANAASQTQVLLDELNKMSPTGNLVSPRTIEKGTLKLVPSNDWTSGFFAGVLWYLYDYTHDDKWLKQARIYTDRLEKEQYNKGTHDLGFMINCSYGNGYRLTQDEHYKAVLIQAAKSLSTRYNTKTGVIRSWDHNADKWKNPVIIDNMMNLELLFKATRLTGDSSFYKIAVSHADHTLKNHFRADYSSYHVVDYDPETGAVLKKMTHQGYSDESAWARGQAWGLYGFTMCYRETGDKKYLLQAQNIAKFIFNNPTLPKDLVPYWDYNDPGIPNVPRDVSAACVMASALYELAGYSKGNNYRQKADMILSSLGKGYLSPAGENFGFILLHSTGHKPANSEIDVPLNYADYYYLEALLRSTKPVKH